MPNEIVAETKDGIAVMTLNRPERMNALAPGMSRLMEQIISRLAEDPEVRVLVLTGAGKAFCSGGDVRNFAAVGGPAGPANEQSAEQRQPPAAPITGLILPFREFPRPVIGAINGAAAGAGFALAMACDLRIASEHARFGSLFIRRALTPASGLTWMLPRLIGAPKALEIMFTGDWIEAQEAERLGIVNRVVPHEQLMPAALELARKIASQPPIALELTKRMVYRGLESSLYQQLDLETYYQRFCFTTEDFRESAQAFVEKRQGRFKGR